VLFDWDGTLVNTAEANYRCYVQLFGSYGIPFDSRRLPRTLLAELHLTYSALACPRTAGRRPTRAGSTTTAARRSC